MSTQAFETLFDPAIHGDRRGGRPDRRRSATTRPYDLPDLSAPIEAEPDPAAEAAPPEPAPPAALVFDEAELARACAAAAAAARRHAIDQDTLQQRAAEERLQASLRASLAMLEAEAAAREARGRARLAELLGAVLETVMLKNAAVRTELVVGALQRCLEDMPSAKDLLLRVAPAESEVIAARLLPLLADPAAAAGTRVVADATLAPGEVRLAWRDSWIELDLEQWLSAVRQRLEHAILHGTNE